MTMSESLTPNDLRNQEFRKTMRGFDPLEVTAVLEEAAESWEKAVADALHWQEKCAALEEQTKKYAEMEKTLQDTLVMARKTAEDQAAAAKKEAELIITDARQQADRVIHEANVRAEKIRQELRDLDQLKLQSKTAIEGALRAFLAQLELFRTDLPTAALAAKPEQDLPPGQPAPPPTPENPEESANAPDTADTPNTPNANEKPAEEYVDVTIGEPGKRHDDFDVALNKIFGGEKPNDPPADQETKPE